MKIIFELKKVPDMNNLENNKELIKEIQYMISEIKDDVDMVYIDTNSRLNDIYTQWVTSNFDFPENVMYIEPVSSFIRRTSGQTLLQQQVTSR